MSSSTRAIGRGHNHPPISRQARYAAGMRAAGFVQVALWVPPSAARDLQDAAETMRLIPGLTVARLVDSGTGKLCGLTGPKVVAGDRT